MICIYFLAIITVFPGMVLAGEYILVEGKGVKVCKEYGKNLNSFGHFMLCERNINDDLIGFKKPEWQKLDLWENRDLVKNVELFLGLQHDYMDSVKWPKIWEDVLKDRIKRGSVAIMMSRVDICNSGKEENVIKYISGYCGSSKSFGAPLLVLHDNRKGVDIAKTIPLMQNFKNVEGWHHAMYDIFIYKNKVYFDRWSGKIDEVKYLKVFVNEIGESARVETKKICRFRFK